MDLADPAPLANVVTLGVQDLARMRDFYRALGWPVVTDDGDLCAFELRGSVLALFPAAKLAADGRAAPEAGRGGLRFTLGIMAERREEVDALAARAERAGARVTKAPEDAEFFDGRSAYFADPEGNFWEVAWAPPDNPVVAAARRAARAGAAGPAPPGG
jgi:predicted lactoylglutathione lyase